MCKAAILAADLGWVVLTAFLAVLIRDNFVADWNKLAAIVPYAAIAVGAAALVFLSAGISNALWRYTSLSDVLRIMAAATVALLLTLFVSFVFNRLEGVARSVPVIQWLLLVGGMIGSRVAFRVWHDHTSRRDWRGGNASDQYALILGVNHLTELYLEAAAEYASRSLHIVGLLTDRQEFHGRLLRRQKILGTPADLLAVMRQLDVHGVTLNRILVVQPYERLSPSVQEALATVERAGSVKVDWLVERLGLDDVADAPVRPEREESSQTLSLASPDEGRPFKLFKFRTIRAAHDELGKRRSDEQRSSVIGRLLRRTKLDELPQLYNVVVGEMSLVGPRPLLPQDQPDHFHARLVTRPGLTGFAQVNGGRDISADDKNTLDLWYVENASLSLDVKILVRTLIVLAVGEYADDAMVRAARAGLKRSVTQNAVVERKTQPPHLSPKPDESRLAATIDHVR